MAPSLFTAQRRRYWLLTTAILENLLFSAVLLGWGSLLLMLKKEGFYLELCTDHDTDYLNITDTNSTGNMTFILPMEDGCIAQDERLNLAYTIGSFLLSGMTFPLGMFMDKFGSRNLRMVGSAMFGFSSVLFAIAQRTKMSILLFPAVSLNGMSGIVHVFTGFQITNMFGDKRGTMLSFLVGAYASSAVVFPAMKGLYDLGISFDTLFFCYGGLMVLVILNCFFNVPKEPIPGPEEMDFRIRFKPFGVHHKLTGKHFYGMVTTVGRRLSIDEKGGPTMASQLDLEVDYSSVDNALNPVAALPPLSKSVCTVAFMWSVVTMCIGQLRLIFFIGALSQMLGRVSEADSAKEAQSTVNIYTSIFGMIQMACILMAPLIGIVLDWNTKPKKPKGAEEELLDDTCARKGSTASACSINTTLNKQRQQQKIKLQKIGNVMKAFTLTNVLMIFFGITVLIPNLELQILTFLLHTLIRGFIHSTVGAMYAVMYHHSHFGTLTGLQSLISAVFACLQYPIFTIINGPLNEDPFWMNVGLLVLTFFNFGLPAYLFLYIKRLKAEPEITKPKTSVVSVDLPKNLSQKTLMTTIKEDELDNDDVFLA